VGTGSTLFSGGLFLRQLRFGGNWLNILFRWIVLDSAQIWRELAPHYFPADCFADLAGTGSTLFFGGLFLRQLRFGGNWLHIIFRQIVYRQLRFGGKWLHINLADCFEGSSDLAGTGSTLFYGRLFWTQMYSFGIFVWELSIFFFNTHCAWVG
jgi:hypothetical protein